MKVRFDPVQQLEVLLAVTGDNKIAAGMRSFFAEPVEINKKGDVVNNAETLPAFSSRRLRV